MGPAKVFFVFPYNSILFAKRSEICSLTHTFALCSGILEDLSARFEISEACAAVLIVDQRYFAEADATIGAAGIDFSCSRFVNTLCQRVEFFFVSRGADRSE